MEAQETNTDTDTTTTELAPRPIKNIDAQLVAAMQPEPVEPVAENVPRGTEEPEVVVDSVQQEPVVDSAQDTEKTSATEKPDKVDNKSDKVVNAAVTDEYGNPVVKEKMYTEAELNQRIRERLARGKYAEQQQTAPIVQQPAVTQVDPDADWETQLKTVIKSTVKEIGQETQQVQWQQAEQARQAEFEEKFTNGMAKYKDFHDVIADKPITDSIMLATRGMDNPAAFLYAAAKTQATELDKIARMTDPYQQAAAIGRLDEKMRKVRTGSVESKVIKTKQGDMTDAKPEPKRSIDDLIHKHAKSKQWRR
jgi:hypothetical protein